LMDDFFGRPLIRFPMAAATIRYLQYFRNRSGIWEMMNRRGKYF
jgi:hypothetical protein